MNHRQDAVRHAVQAHAGQLVYGLSDCCQVALSVAREISGKPIDAPAYASAADAMSVIDRYGSMEQMVTAILGRGPTDNPPRDGDLALVHLVGVGQALAIWAGGSPLARGRARFVRVPAKHTLLTWSVD